ncbi:DgyrCDS1330 [Dimorphilus gyrociliatus]|uniref:Leucine zipper transcription factor-like protein 1 n=1 Tax=Dimorphilus gyrociliatus TaxID=2664684 RepID=A0A7I8V780_9ANNE|nr:DgyrCDS1330 [Dimorphilus gyrociliatus]
MSSALGLNEGHQSTVLNYMRFARYQRGQRLRGIDASFKELKDSRLCEDTFTVDEVEDMLDGLLVVIRGEMESELLNTAHTNVLLLRQLFQQAEKWHLKLQADISELENRELLEQIKEFEEQQFSGVKKDAEFKLQPLNESSSSNLLQAEINRLRDENDTLRQRLKQAESQAMDAGRDRNKLKSELENARSNLSSSSRDRRSIDDGEFDELQRKMKGLKSELDHTKMSSRETAESLGSDLTKAKHELLKIRADLELAEKQLEKKVSQTAPFKNLKQMLQKKNDQIKELRRRLGDDDDY